MKKPVIITLGVFILIVGVLMWWYSDAQVIERQSHELADALTIESTDGKSSRLSKTQDFSGLLDPSVTCTVDVSNYQSDFRHDDLQSAHHMMAHNCESSSAKISQIEITELTDTQATVDADLILSVTRKDGPRHGEACDAVLIWKKNDSGKWKIESIEIKGS